MNQFFYFKIINKLTGEFFYSQAYFPTRAEAKESKLKTFGAIWEVEDAEEKDLTDK